MEINIEREYRSFVSGVWQNLFVPADDILELNRNNQTAYEAISCSTAEFLQDKLDNIENNRTLKSSRN